MDWYINIFYKYVCLFWGILNHQWGGANRSVFAEVSKHTPIGGLDTFFDFALKAFLGFIYQKKIIFM